MHYDNNNQENNSKYDIDCKEYSLNSLDIFNSQYKRYIFSRIELWIANSAFPVRVEFHLEDKCNPSCDIDNFRQIVAEVDVQIEWVILQLVIYKFDQKRPYYHQHVDHEENVLRNSESVVGLYCFIRCISRLVAHISKIGKEIIITPHQIRKL